MPRGLYFAYLNTAKLWEIFACGIITTKLYVWVCWNLPVKYIFLTKQLWPSPQERVRVTNKECSGQGARENVFVIGLRLDSFASETMFRILGYSMVGFAKQQKLPDIGTSFPGFLHGKQVSISSGEEKKPVCLTILASLVLSVNTCTSCCSKEIEINDK